MKFVCERCQTKYSIADEKVRQKVLKIRCKTCENVITIRDAVVVNEPAAPRAEPPPSPVAGPRSAVEWHLAVNGQQTGPFGLAALCTAILKAARTDEVYVWNEHLDGWKEPKLVPDVANELRLRSAPSHPTSPPRRVPTPNQPAVARPSGAMPAVTGAAARTGRPSSNAMAAVAEFASPGEEEKTQISPLDASLLRPDAGAARPQPTLSLFGKGATAAVKPAEKPAPRVFDKPAEKRTEAKADIGHGAGLGGGTAPLPSHGNGLTGRSSAAMAAVAAPAQAPLATGLESLDFAPPLVAPSAANGTAAPASALQSQPAFDLPLPTARPATNNGVPVPVVGGTTSMLLSQVGGKVSRPRHPAVKFVVLGLVLLGGVGVIAAISMKDGEKPAASTKPAEPVAANNGVDPEARARAEAEEVFKSRVGDSSREPAPVTKSVGPGPAPRRAPPPRTKTPEPAPSVAPPPMAPPPQPGADTSRVTQRFSMDERRVAVPTKDRARGSEEFDIQKFMAVFKQPDHYSAIKSCYDRALKRDNNLKLARLDINVTVGETGNVKKVRIEAPTDFNVVKTCIQDSVKRWHFPGNSKEYEAAFPLILQGNSE